MCCCGGTIDWDEVERELEDDETDDETEDFDVTEEFDIPVRIVEEEEVE